MNRIKSLPKIELHPHLDCSLSYEVVSKINPAITEQEYLPGLIATAICTNPADFFYKKLIK